VLERRVWTETEHELLELGAQTCPGAPRRSTQMVAHSSGATAEVTLLGLFPKTTSGDCAVPTLKKVLALLQQARRLTLAVVVVVVV
jgi:hypothetical protein